MSRPPPGGPPDAAAEPARAREADAASSRPERLEAEHADVLLVTKKDRVDSNTNYAQGGVAAAVAPDDSPDMHVRDTLLAGAGLCHRRSVEELAREGPPRVRELMEWGVRFSRTGDGRLSLGREGGHSRRRILHAADLTGREIERALLRAVAGSPRIRVLDDHFLWRLRTVPHPDTIRARCGGAWVLDVRARRWIRVAARAVLLATGGCGRLYRHTTNPDIAAGDGIAAGWLAGAAVANLEFVQFHPTALHPAGSRAFLITEALRGEGAVLRGPDGEPFMERYHPAGSLAPRDVVARAIDEELRRTGAEHVRLDVSAVPPDVLEARFPTILSVCRAEGIDVPAAPIPVVPAAHYQCGGLLTDWDGRTSLPGLFAAGEVACTGVHGANRLASNSLLEAVVFAHRAARRLVAELPALPAAGTGGAEEADGPPDPPEPVEPGGARRARAGGSAPGASAGTRGAPSGPGASAPDEVEREVRDAMWEEVGMVRSDARLERARERLDALAGYRADPAGADAGAMQAREVEFLVLVASLVVRCARRRLESRGLHYTGSHPHRDGERFLRDTVLAR